MSVRVLSVPRAVRPPSSVRPRPPRVPRPQGEHRAHARGVAGSPLSYSTHFPGSCGKFSFSVLHTLRQISHLFLEKFISVLHSLEANISFISREIYLGFAQPRGKYLRGKYLIYFSRNLSRFCTASRQIAYLFLEKFSFPPHFRWVVGAHGHDRLIRRGVQQSGRNSNSKTKKKRRKKKFEGIEPTSGCLQAGCNTTGPRAP